MNRQRNQALSHEEKMERQLEKLFAEIDANIRRARLRSDSKLREWCKRMERRAAAKKVTGPPPPKPRESDTGAKIDPQMERVMLGTAATVLSHYVPRAEADLAKLLQTEITRLQRSGEAVDFIVALDRAKRIVLDGIRHGLR